MPFIKGKNENNWVFNVPKGMISDKFVNKFLEYLKFNELLQQSQLSEKHARQLSEDVKSSWWEQNRDRILKNLEQE